MNRTDSEMNYSDIEYRVEHSVLTLRLNRPDKLNALTMNMIEELCDAFSRASQDDQIRVIVITGNGRAFCAGADLSLGGATFDARHSESLMAGVAPRGDRDWYEPRDSGGVLALAIYDCPKPVIAAINGPAVGAGATMTLAADLRYCSSNAKIGFVFSRRGILPDCCSSWFLPQIVGMGHAQDWVISGRLIEAEEAARSGLVNAVFESDQLLPATMAWARGVAENSSMVSAMVSRRMLYHNSSLSNPADAHDVESRGQHLVGMSADAAEGVESFLEKRPPGFSGRLEGEMLEFYKDLKD